MTCAACGHPLTDDARFCSECGSPVGGSLRTEERKMVTIVFADLVDSTGLAQRLDPERARMVLGRFYDAVNEELTALRGEAEKFIGDAVMAVFGLPRTHEDDAVRAVRVGFAIQGRLRRLSEELGLPEPLRVRVGIESGETATGRGPSGQLLVTGPVVNAAARLQTGAEPGEILVGETTYALTETSISFAEPRAIAAKGFDRALIAYPVTGLTTRSARRTIPFVGRADELLLLRSSFSRAASSSRPILFTVVGEAGIGKSRLADEFLAGLGPETTVLVGRTHPSADSATFAPAAAIVRDVAGIDEDDPAEKIARRLSELADRFSGPDVERLAARLQPLVDPEEGGRDSASFVTEVQAGFLTLVRLLATDTPLVLVLDDVHAMRPPMLDLIERLAARRDPPLGGVFVLVSARPSLVEERTTWGASAANHVSLRLEPLAPDDAVSLARQAGGGRIEERDAAAVAERAGGNPFFIVESTGMLIRQQEEGRFPAGGLPPTVQAMVAARLDALAPPLRDLTRRLSVFFYSFDLAEVGLVAPAAGETDLQELVDAEIVVRDDGAPRWRFRHETLRDVAYASLPKRERRALHVAIADELLAQRHRSWAAEHLEAAALAALDLDPTDRALPERAAEALAAAADRARRRMENRSAVDLSLRALAMAGPEDAWDVREARVLAGLGEARYWLGEYGSSRETLQRALAIADRIGDPWSRSLALRFLGDIAINVDGDVDEAERLLARSLEAAEQLGDPAAITRTLLFAGWVPWTRHDFDAAEPIWRRALELAREHGDRWAQVRALTSLSINREHVDDFDDAAALIDEARSLAEETGDRFSMAVSMTQQARLHQDLGEWDDAVSLLDRAIAIFDELGARWEYADAMAERGITKREQGRLDDAEDDLHQAIRISEELGERQLASWTWRALAKVAERRGDQAALEERLRRAEQEEARRPR